MQNALFSFPLPENEPIKEYKAGSPELELLDKELKRQSNTVVDIPLIIGGKRIFTKNKGNVVMPHDHKHVLATYSIAEIGRAHV